ncbi:hypothetical protein [Streptomyces sp. NPDC000983]|uniref:hypothetical protein n=1 Tax=Streptomyces sp. NPDC000983 TaxID=3154373 RepID=UPI00331E49D3
MSPAPGVSAYFDWLFDMDAVAGFNHPGRESGRVDDFAHDSAVHDRMVGLEMSNRGRRLGRPQCLRPRPGRGPCNDRPVAHSSR